MCVMVVHSSVGIGGALSRKPMSLDVISLVPVSSLHLPISSAHTPPSAWYPPLHGTPPQQGVMTTIREAANQYPFVSLHRNTMQLAVGVPTPHHPTSLSRSDSGSGRRNSLTGGAESAGHQVVVVYELEGGTPRWALHSGAGIHDADCVACVAWSPSGDLVAAYAPAVRCLFVWWLVKNWSARFSRGPSSLQPKGVAMLRHDGAFVEVAATVAGRTEREGRGGGGAGDMGYVVRWVDEQHIEVVHHGRVQGTARWPFGAG